jgi:hypothetical protein
LLGLRRFKNVQIDIWQGDIDTFAADGILKFSRSTELSVRVEENNENSNTSVTLLASTPPIHSINLHEIGQIYHNSFLAFEQTKLRHLIISDIADGLGQSLSHDGFVSHCMTTLRHFIDSDLSHSMQRVTFVARDPTVYDMLQRHLFAEFPDELDEEGY